jgi:hypothetical protein
MPLPLIAAIGIGVAAAGGIAQTISGISRTNKAKKALAGFQRQRLTNITEGMRVSTMGAELQTQEAQRRFATSVDALRSGGVRGLVGGLGQVEQQQQIGQQQIAAGLDQQQQQIDMMRAEDEGRIRSMIENRESAAIAGMGAELQNARQTTNAGISGIAGAGLAAFTAGVPAGGLAKGAVDATGAAAKGFMSAGQAADAVTSTMNAGRDVLKAKNYVGSGYNQLDKSNMNAFNAFGGGSKVTGSKIVNFPN